MAEELHSVVLKNGLVLRFADQTNRYFGDFHRIRIKVSLELPEKLQMSTDISCKTVSYERTLEKMGVSTATLDAARSTLIKDFLATSTGYFENPDFPQQLLRKMQREKPRPVFLQNRKL